MDSNRHQVDIKIESIGAKTEGRDGPQLQIKAFIPGLGFTQFATPLFIPLSEAEQMNVGDTYSVVLEQGKVKKDKQGVTPTEFYWNFSGMAAPPAPNANEVYAEEIGDDSADVNLEALEDTKPVVVSPTHPVDATRHSIEQQVLMKLACEAVSSPSDDQAVPQYLADVEAVFTGLQSIWYSNV